MTGGERPGRTVGFGHVGLQVRDLERSRAYYRDVIGLVELERLTRSEPYLAQVTGYAGVSLEIALLAEHESGVILELIEYPAGLGRPIDAATAASSWTTWTRSTIARSLQASGRSTRP
jgi:catechol 2,3-dioxygenase-like lactoylglutathione lyase family enzyme